MRTTKTIRERPPYRASIALQETLNACRRSVTERVDALVIISRHKSHDTPSNHFVNELLINGIEILIFIHDQMLQVNKGNRIEISSKNMIQTLTNDFTRENT
jgi:hypothetical protein